MLFIACAAIKTAFVTVGVIFEVIALALVGVFDACGTETGLLAFEVTLTWVGAGGSRFIDKTFDDQLIEDVFPPDVI
ncbi:MAG: hypothetical protein ACD_37C00311G0001 [uncultured bacterium]|nr:MAG: hypothetical protein ACD_37C00311G0001 [uncultured bacterium]